jgi:hypothetical protein
MLSTQPDQLYHSGFTRYMTLQWVDHAVGGNSRALETNLRWGMGKTLGFFSNTLTLGALSYIGIRPLRLIGDDLGVQSDFGLLTVVQTRRSFPPHFRIETNVIAEGNLGYRVMNDLSCVVLQLPWWSLALRYRLYDLSWASSWGGLQFTWFL